MEIYPIYKLLVFVLGMLSFQTLGAILDKRLSSSNTILQMVEINESEWDNNTESNFIPNSNTHLSHSEFVPVDEKVLENATSYQCNLSQSLVQEIKNYQTIADKIFKTLITGSFKGRTYNELGYFVDRFGSRVAGSQNLENAIDYVLDKAMQDGLENVHGEDVTIPHWVRGEESAYLISPRKKKLALLGLGFSVGTPPDGITAEILVVSSFEELKSKADQVPGKIVVYNEKYTSYGETVKYRGSGASEASKYGAVATLIRSVTPFSINSPHTGMQTYEANVTKIPTACITIEDAQMLHRMQKRGDKLIIQLKMNDTNLPFVTSRNAIAEVKGREKPDEVVVVSGHMDSWDVGQGAMDDGGGLFISLEAVALIKFLGLRPRRTLRFIGWTTEEFGLWGVQEYIKRHAAEMDKFSTVFESDIGTFKPLGLDFSGTDEAGCILQEVLKLMKPINATTYRKQAEVGSDIGYFIEKGVPGVSLNTENSKYFYYHHSEGDMMTVENSDELDLCTAVWATASYVLADLSVALPR